MARLKRRDRLSQAIREILFREWDPIGVNENPLVADEYDSYVPAMSRMLEAGADEAKLTAHLRRLRMNTMGLPDGESQQEHDRDIAQRLRSLLG
jgi:hypothetical protein